MGRPRKIVLNASEPNKVENLPDGVKFISENPAGFSFMMKVLDENGKQVYAFDANGEKKLAQWKKYDFIKVQTRNKDGKVETRAGYCFYIVSRKEHGADYERFVAHLLWLKEHDQFAKLLLEDEHFKKRNPEAFRYAEEVAEKDDAIARLEAENKALMERLGLK